MKYKRLNNQNIRVYFNAACSKCGKDVDLSDKFCRNCGHELSQLPVEISMEKVCEILTQAVRNKEGCASAEKNLKDMCVGRAQELEETAPNVPPSGLQDIVNKPKCLHGGCDPFTCGHCLPSGACDASVLTSCPPKYNMCPFRGEGFITCEDVL